MSTGKADALLFDLGQVIIGIDFDRAFAAWASHAGCDPQSLGSRFSQDEPYKLHEVGKISHTEYFDSLRESLGINITDAQFLEGWNAIFVGEMPGIADLLGVLATKMPLYAFSNTNAAHEACWLPQYSGALSHLEHIFCSSTIGLRKPEPEAFQHVIKEMEVPAERVLFFDDAAENIEGAQACGLQTVHVTTPDCVTRAVTALDI